MAAESETSIAETADPELVVVEITYLETVPAAKKRGRPPKKVTPKNPQKKRFED